MAPEHAQKPQDHKSTDQDAESDWKPTNTTSDRIMAVHIVRLSRPEEDDGEKIGSGDEGDDERHGQDPWVLPETAWEHGIFGAPQFPGHECYEQENPEERRGEHVCRVPFILPQLAYTKFPSGIDVPGSRPMSGLGLSVSYKPLPRVMGKAITHLR